MRIAVVIPAYNEELHILSVVRGLPHEIDGAEVIPIVVNDGSRDRTADLVGRVGRAILLEHKTNLGKGAAAKTGCDAAYMTGAEVIVLMDGDGQHRAEDLPKMIEPIIEHRADLVLGVRERNRKMPMTMRIGNRILNGASKLFFGITAKDTQSGYRAFSRSAYPKIRWAASHYAMETEMLILAGRQKMRVEEIEVPTVYHDHYKGTTPIDGFRILGTLLKWRLFWHRQISRLEKFAEDAVEEIEEEAKSLSPEVTTG